MRSVKLACEILKAGWRKWVLRQKNGMVVRKFASAMGVAYIKFAQILAMQNYGEIFTEDDRQILATICDDLNPVSFRKILRSLEENFENPSEIFASIETKPLGSASVSQVHKAILKTGEVVAVKIKRKDVTKTVVKDVRTMRWIVHHFGKFVGFKNFSAGDKALDLYLQWILEETDFRHEVSNIKTYQKFAESVNGKVLGAKKIVMPQVYEEFCNDNVITMSYIPHQTINQMELNSENKRRIATAIDSYLQLSFYAMFNGLPIIFHGDPHSGNIYLDEDGNIGFLDMGLLAQVPAAETDSLMKFFLAAYSGDAEKIYNALVEYGEMSLNERYKFRADCEVYAAKIREADITHYFVDMMNIVINYEFVPPEFLFSMAKAFVCLYGINGFTENATVGVSLVRRQVAEYLARRSLCDCEEILQQGALFLPRTAADILTRGVEGGLVESALRLEDLLDLAKKAVTNYREVMELI